jgi:hypothetical protein
MADQLHYALVDFRNTMLNAVAKLEFQIRDSVCTPRNFQRDEDVRSYSGENDLQKMFMEEIMRRLEALERAATMSTNHSTPPPSPEINKFAEEILKMQPSSNTKNILVSSVRSTPALAAAVAAASALPPLLDLNLNFNTDLSAVEKDDFEEGELVEPETDDEEGEVVEVIEDDEVEPETEDEEGEVIEETEAEAEVVEEAEPELKKITLSTGTYYIDEENNAYQEVDDEYVQVGMYNPKTKRVEELEAEEDVEEAEEAIEVEDFVYKGHTYQKDQENNIYLDGEHIGTWNGKRIIPLPAE